MNALIICAVVLLHPYWETGNYTQDIVDRLRAEDEDRAIRWDGTREPKYDHITTNTVHWMQAHTTTNAPSFTFDAWAEYGWVSLEWCDELGGKWEAVVDGRIGHYEYASFRVYMHPQSELTQRMLASDAGFFRLTNRWRHRILNLSMDGFFPEPEPFVGPPNPYIKSLAFPPIPGG